MNRSDVLIIGSGISALTSAALLSKKGKSVTVLEQYVKPGGYMHSFQRFGEIFDSGAHYVGALGHGQSFRVLLDYLNLDATSLFCPLDPTGFDVLKFPEGEVAIPQGYAQVIEELISVFPNDRDAIRTYFSMVRSVVQHYPTYKFSDETDPTSALESLETSLKSIVEKLTSNPRLQSVFYAYCNLHGVSPGETPFGFHAIVTDSLIEGPYGLIGGGDALVEKFTAQITKNGGRILTKHKVVEIRTKNRVATEVVCENGAVFSAEWVISAIHPKAAFRLIDDASVFTPAFNERLAQMKESPGIFGMYTSCEGGSFNPLRNHYYFRTSNPDAMFAAKRPDEEPALVFASSAKREWLPGDGNLPVSFLSPCESSWFDAWKNQPYGRRSPDYSDFKAKLATQALSLVARYDSNLAGKVQHAAGAKKSVASTPMTNMHFNGSEEGSAYGIYHSIQNTGARALGPRTKIINLLLTGQSVVFPGLLGAAISGLRTSGHIIGMKPLLKELKEFGLRA